MSNWFAEIRAEGGVPLVECDFASYLHHHPQCQTSVTPDEIMDRTISVGNEFLDKMKQEHPGKRLHFDIFFNEHALTGEGDAASQKAFIGITWAFNPAASHLPGIPFFWTFYSEKLMPEVPYIGKVKKDLLAYLNGSAQNAA